MKLLFILLGIGGLAAICYGGWLIYPPLAYIFIGIVALLVERGGYNIWKKGGR